MADDLTPFAKNIAQHTADSAVLVAVVGSLIGVLEATNSDLTSKIDEMFNAIIQQMNVIRDKLVQPTSAVESFFFERYSKEIDNIQGYRKSSRVRTEELLKEVPLPKA